MVEHRIKCEMCDNSFQFSSPMQRPFERTAPPGWFIVFPYDEDMRGSEGWHFCSRSCLNRWTASPSHEEVQA